MREPLPELTEEQMQLREITRQAKTNGWSFEMTVWPADGLIEQDDVYECTLKNDRGKQIARAYGKDEAEAKAIAWIKANEPTPVGVKSRAERIVARVVIGIIIAGTLAAIIGWI